ncbi:MAG: DegT/DnrJ/EryC1/StrS family aminotransferase, partial [Alphaproteobacteria bacterium]
RIMTESCGASAGGQAAVAVQNDPVPLIDVKAQYQALKSNIDKRIERVLSEGRFVLGPEVDELQTRLADFCGARHAIACASGTDALSIPLMAEKIGPGDAVFVPAYTFVATAGVVAGLGATPVFVDIDPYSLTMDVGHLEQRIKDIASAGELSPRAIIPVDLFGRPADYRAINALAESHNLFVLSDAAQSFGGSRDNKSCGTMALVSATSFYPSKTLGAFGDAGCMFTDDDDRAEVLRALHKHGMGDDGPAVLHVGVNSRLDNIQAAILLAKLDVFAIELDARRQAAEAYCERLDGVVDLPASFDEGEIAWSVFAIRCDERDRVRAALSDENISTTVYYNSPIHLEPAYRHYGDGPGSLPVSERLSKRSLALPMHAYLNDATIDRVCDAVIRAVE